MAEMIAYDEFGLFHENAEEAGLPWNGPPEVARRSVEVNPGQDVSLVVWGNESAAEAVFLHGGGQNAHTWDTVALALGRPLVCIDLPGHGHSSWREDRDYWAWSNAEAVAQVMERYAPRAKVVIGMSLGGLTTIRLGAVRPDLVKRAVIVDVTPGVGAKTIQMTTEQRGATALIGASRAFNSFEEILEATVKSSPQRPVSALRRGVLHYRQLAGFGIYFGQRVLH